MSSPAQRKPESILSENKGALPGQSDQVEEHHPPWQNQDRLRQAEDAQRSTCVSARISRILWKRSLATLVQPALSGSLTRGGSRWPKPPRASMGLPAEPPTRTCSTRRRIAWPRSLTERCITHPRPAAPHARASSSLGVKIGGPFDYDAGGPGGWWIIDAPELHLGEEIVVPDLAGWRRERMPKISRHGVFHAGAGLGLRGTLRLDSQDRSTGEASDLRPRRSILPVACRPD